MENLLIQSKDMVLIQQSETAKDTRVYGNLFEGIRNCISLRRLDQVKPFEFDSKAISTIQNNLKELIDVCGSEWIGSTDYVDSLEAVCELCGQKNPRFMYHIRNKLNNHEMVVGSTCINKFKKIDHAILRTARKRYINDKQRREEDKRKIIFDTHEIDYDFTKRAQVNLDNLNIVLPKYMMDQVVHAIYKLNSIRTTFIKDGGDEIEVFKSYDNAKGNYEIIWGQALAYYESKQSDPLVCNKIVGDWLKEKLPVIYDQIAKNGGILTEETLSMLYEPTFIQGKLTVFRSCIKNRKELRLKRLRYNMLYFTLCNDRFQQPVTFKVSTQWFMRNIGCHCLTQYNYKYNEITLLDGISVEFSQSNFEAMYNMVIPVIKPLYIDLEYESVVNNIYFVKIPKTVQNDSEWNRLEKF